STPRPSGVMDRPGDIEPPLVNCFGLPPLMSVRQMSHDPVRFEIRTRYLPSGETVTVSIAASSITVFGVAAPGSIIQVSLLFSSCETEKSRPFLSQLRPHSPSFAPVRVETRRGLFRPG